MHLTIKDPEAQRFAREIAQATGETMSRVVIEALRARHAEIGKLEEPHPKATLEELRDLVKKFNELPVISDLDPHGDWLYDEFGLPK